jgi:hypothetical protein
MNDEPTPEEDGDKRIQQADHLNRLTSKIYWATAIILFGFVLVQVIFYFRK